MYQKNRPKTLESKALASILAQPAVNPTNNISEPHFSLHTGMYNTLSQKNVFTIAWCNK